MGSSSSKNIVQSVTRAIAKVSTAIIQNTRLTTDLSQIISVNDIEGDVVISGNTFTQEANLNLNTLFMALNSQDAQQSLLQELVQQAKSTISDFNIAQFSNAQDVMNLFVQAYTEVLTNISQQCLSDNNQRQTITISRVQGNVYIQNNVYEQVEKILQSCAEKTVSNNSLLQSISDKINQSSSASAQGLSIWAIVGLIALIVGLPVAGAVIGGISALQTIFPVLLVAGLVMLLVGYFWTRDEMRLTGYSSLIKNTESCQPVSIDQNVGSFATAIEASSACEQNKACTAFDWQGLNQPLPITMFYSSVNPSCSSQLQPDNTPVYKVPALAEQEGDPVDPDSYQIGDYMLNKKTGQIYILTDVNNTKKWYLRGIITSTPFTSITWSYTDPRSLPPPTVENQIYGYVNENQPTILYVFRSTSQGDWVQEKQMQGPGIIATAPPVVNTSGFKTQQRKNGLLWAGGLALLVGIVGTIVTYQKKNGLNI